MSNKKKSSTESSSADSTTSSSSSGTSGTGSSSSSDSESSSSSTPSPPAPKASTITTNDVDRKGKTKKKLNQTDDYDDEMAKKKSVVKPKVTATLTTKQALILKRPNMVATAATTNTAQQKKKIMKNDKKKSIFSPENSSDDNNSDSGMKPRSKAAPKQIISSASSASSSSSSSSSSLTSDSDSKKRHSPRKSARNNRKSKQVATSKTNDDSCGGDSDDLEIDTKKVKKPTINPTKTKSSKKVDDKKKPVLLQSNCIVERKCPLDSCQSHGHLSGKFDRHFTLDACPLYHNLTHVECKNELIERKKREDMRKASKNYLQKIKELRSIKQEPSTSSDQKPTIDRTKESDLRQFVSDYDLQLFRTAQACASEKIETELEQLPSTRGTKSIKMGKFDMEVWYQSPYPEDYAHWPKLYICEYCLRYMKSRTILERHVIKCVWRHPPGDEVYRKDKVSVWEVDGKKYKQYCQNLCLLAKFFLDHKTLYYDVEPFLFYVMTLVDHDGCHTVGYFSKEKNSFLNYNVSCILTLPPYQRQGYGRLLIDFSYLLTRVEGKIGSPEKPLSDLGLISYRSYWKDVLLNYLCSRAGTTLSVKDISQEMAIHSYDIVSTLQALGMMKYWKGKHIILKKQDVLDEYVERVQKRRLTALKEIDPSCLRWRPPVHVQPQV